MKILAFSTKQNIKKKKKENVLARFSESKGVIECGIKYYM